MLLPQSIGALKASGWKSRGVKDELRENLLAAMARREKLFAGIVGYDQTVIPQVVNAILARHNLILLGLRGQAKTRILRALVNLLDEFMPVIKGSEINDDPYRPLSKRARWWRSEATTSRLSGCTVTSATPKSWPRRTSASRT